MARQNLGDTTNNFAATVDPTVNDDIGDGYDIGSRWVNVTDDTAFVCVDNSSGAAVWVEVTAGAAGGIANVVEDTTPQLGGNLDMNGNNIQGVTPTEMGYVSGVTSAIQTQLDGKSATTHDHDADYQPLDAELTAVAGLVSAANKLPYFTGSGTAALADLTAFARSILDDADEATFKATVNLEIGTDVQAYDAELAAIAGLTSAANKVPYFTGSGTASLLDFLDEDAMGSNSATAVASQQSIKAYVDTQVATQIANVVEDTTPQLGGDLDANGNDITDAQRIIFDATPDADHTATGMSTATINAGATIAAFECVYLASDGEWAKADASATATADKLLAIALEAGTDTNPMDVALPGSFIRDDTWAWTVGGAIYLSETAGALTQTAPTTTDAVVRVLGYAVSADVMYFMPETGITHA